MIGYKNTISGGSGIMQPIRIPENTRNVILVMNLRLYHVWEKHLSTVWGRAPGSAPACMMHHAFGMV